MLRRHNSSASSAQTSDGTLLTISAPKLTGTGTVGETVTILDGDTVLGKVVVDATGKWSFTCPTLTKGEHELSVYLTDSLGNSGLLSDPLSIQV